MKRSNLNNISLNYQPQTDFDAGATVHVKMKASEPLRKMKNGEVTLYVNDVPHSIAAADLEKSTDDAFTYVSIPVDPGTLKAQPTLSIQWQVSGLEPEEICAPVTSGKWAYIDEESSLELSLSDEVVEPNFNLWPNPFGLQTEDGASTLVILPESNEDVMKELQALFTSFTYAHEQTDL